jgi:HEAT repeat protein
VRKLLGLVLVLGLASATAAADVQDLVKKLESKDNEVRRAAAKDLGEMGKDAAPAVKALIKALKDEDRFVKRWSAEALGKIGPEAKSSIPALTALLEDGSQPVRDAAVKALAKMGPDALDGLKKALSGASDVQEPAIEALVALGPEAVPALTGAIKDSKMNATLRRKAVEGVAKHPRAGKDAVGALAEVVKNPRAQGQEGNRFRFAAIEALGKLATKDDKDAVNVLDNIAKDEKANRQLRAAVTKALKAIQSK